MTLLDVTPALRNPLTSEGELLIGGTSGAPARLARPDYDRTLRRSGPTLIFGRTKEAYLNDRADIDATGTDDMGATITTYLAEMVAAGVRRVYLDRGSVYRLATGITVPGKIRLEGPAGPHNSFTANAGEATLVAAASGLTMLTMPGSSAQVCGVKLDLGGNTHTNVVGIRPESYLQRVDDCVFDNGNADGSSTGVRGGGLLYFNMARNVFGQNGRAVDLLKANALDPVAAYYGVNVGCLEQNIFGGAAGSVRAQGILTLEQNDFEGGAGSIGPALEIVTTGANSYVNILNNYFEMVGASKGILLSAGTAAVIRGNDLYGVQASVGGYGIKCAASTSRLDITGNGFNRFETGIDLGTGPESTNWAGHLLGANAYLNCTTPVTGGVTGRTSGSANTTGALATAIVQRGDGRITHRGAVTGGAVYWTDAAGLTLDLRQGNLFHLDMTTGGTLGLANAGYGQRFALYFAKGTVTLNTITWHLASGVNETPPAGTVKAFIVDYFGAVREVGPLA